MAKYHLRSRPPEFGTIPDGATILASEFQADIHIGIFTIQAHGIIETPEPLAVPEIARWQLFPVDPLEATLTAIRLDCAGDDAWMVEDYMAVSIADLWALADRHDGLAHEIWWIKTNHPTMTIAEILFA
jgi:hypothetical protein